MNRQTQMMTYWLAEKNISTEGLNEKEIVQEVAKVFKQELVAEKLTQKTIKKQNLGQNNLALCLYGQGAFLCLYYWLFYMIGESEENN